MEKNAETIPNGSFTTCIPVFADDEDGLELDFDSDEEGDGDNGNDGGDGGGDGNSNRKKRKKRRCYKPKIGSAIHTYMDCILIKVKTRHPSINVRTCWIPPPNPLSKTLGRLASPDIFYLAKTWVYVFEPEIQCDHLMCKKLQYPHCHGSNTKYTRYAYRPARWGDLIIQVVHRRVECKDCECEWATINENALDTLNPRIKNLFPFTFPTKYGPGLAKNTLHLHLASQTKGIDTGTFHSIVQQGTED